MDEWADGWMLKPTTTNSGNKTTAFDGAKRDVGRGWWHKTPSGTSVIKRR